MTLLAVERIKLFTTRSPWWCAAVALAIVIGFAALITGTAPSDFPVTVRTSQFGYSFGLAVIMVLAALSITTEYRFGTIKSTFLAVPNRPAVLLAKTGVVALVALVIGELAAFGALGVSTLLAPSSADIALNSAADWRQVAGVGVVYALTAAMGVAVGAMVRHSAGAISLLLIYGMVVESLVPLIPRVGEDIHKWLSFNVAEKFLSGGAAGGVADGPPLSTSTLSPGWALAYFAGVAAVLLAVAIVITRRRDA
ncbi:MAG: hypothetical protein GEU97_03840 [Actinophytocola sp.]|nr:hypothetical protein [Actinophytocola sp.]